MVLKSISLPYEFSDTIVNTGILYSTPKLVDRMLCNFKTFWWEIQIEQANVEKNEK